MNLLARLKHFVFNKKFRLYWIFGVIAVVLVWFFFFRNPATVETITVHPAEFLQQVSVAGNLVATQNLDLSFQQTGVVQKVYAKVGDKVTSGQLLASQDVSQLYAQYQEMQAGIDLQKAKLTQLLAGASPEDVKVAEDALALAQQKVHNAYQTSLIDLSDAYGAIYSAYNAAIYIQRTYFIGTDSESGVVQTAKDAIGTALADAKAALDLGKSGTGNAAVDSAIGTMISDLSKTYENLSLIRIQCESGVYYSRVSSTDKTSLDNQKTSINTELSSVTSAKQTIANDKISLQQAQSQLDLKKAAPRTTDIAVYQAQIKQAEAGLQNVGAQIRKQQIYTPINGVVTLFDAKLGNVFSANQTAVSVISEDPLEIESYVPEIYIPLIKLGDVAHVTLDAYGPDTVFEAHVVSIDPSETLKNGVSSYKTKLQFKENADQFRSGMSANVLITTQKKENVIAIPQRIVENKEGKKFVKVQNGKQVVEREVQTGMVSSLGQVEITSGLVDGDVVIVKQ